MDNLINDFILFVKTEFDLDAKPNELKKIIGNNSVMFKTFQIIMLKFKSKQNGDIIKKKLEINTKKCKLKKLITELNKVQNDLLHLIKVINERNAVIKKGNQLKEFYEFKQMRVKQLIKLMEQILKSSEQEANLSLNLNKIDKTISLLNLKLNLDEIDDKYLPPQINYSLVEKQIDELVKEINGSIYEISELMKNQDFNLELGEDFIENLTRTNYNTNAEWTKENIKSQFKDARLIKLSKHYENYKERTTNLYNKHKDKVFDLIKKVDQTYNN